MKSFRPHLHRVLLAAALLALTLAVGCKRHQLSHHEYMYVSAEETSLRDRVATMYNKVGTLHNGDRVEVLEKQRRFLRVRTDDGKEGWLEERSLVPQDIYDGFQKLADDYRNRPVQAHGTTRAELNMHLTPSREAEHLYQLKDSEKVEILKRATAEKNPPKQPPPRRLPAPPRRARRGHRSQPARLLRRRSRRLRLRSAPKPEPKAKSKAGEKVHEGRNKPQPGKPVMEDWYLVRNSAGRVGWVLLRMVDLDIPLDVAQYAEGQRIVGYFVLNTVGRPGQAGAAISGHAERAQGRFGLGLQPDSRFHLEPRQPPLRDGLSRSQPPGISAGEDRPSAVRQGRRPSHLHHPHHE